MKVKELKPIIVSSVDTVKIFKEKSDNVCKYEELYEGELNKAPKEISNMQVVYIGASDACLITIKVR